MLNPDGVFLGNQRSDLLGSDLNRCWNRATTFAHPALIAVNDLIQKINAEKASMTRMLYKLFLNRSLKVKTKSFYYQLHSSSLALINSVV